MKAVLMALQLPATDIDSMSDKHLQVCASTGAMDGVALPEVRAAHLC